MKSLTFEKFLYKKGYTTQNTSTIKLKCNVGVSKFAKDMFDILNEGDASVMCDKLMRLVAEVQEMKYKK